MSSIKVNFDRPNGERVVVKVNLHPHSPYSLMEAAKLAGLEEIPATCGGHCSCGTCHVHLDKPGKIDYNTPEIDILEFEKDYIEGKSRLACQIELKPEHDGLVVKLRDNELL